MSHNEYQKAYHNDRVKRDPEYAERRNEISLASYHRQSKGQPSRGDRRRAAGMCVACGHEPPVDGILSCEHCRIKANERNKVVIDAVFDHYGRKCECCGEDEFQFLTLDHIDGAGAKHRSENGGRNFKKHLYLEAQRTGVWQTGLRVLCFNCNCGRQRNGGICPHEQAAASNDPAPLPAYC